jgi:hypothetical protein
MTVRSAISAQPQEGQDGEDDDDQTDEVDDPVHVWRFPFVAEAKGLASL